MDKEQMRALLDVSVEAVDYIAASCGHGADDSSVPALMDNLRRIAAAVEAETQEADGLLQKVYLYARNIQASMEDLQQDASLFARVFSYEIRPFVLEMQRLWHLAAEVLSDDGSKAQYQGELMQAMRDLHDAPPAEYRYDVTIVLCGYNKLEYTKTAAESIFAHTDFSNGRVELITINNGSDDGTREFFESLPHTKKINLKYNILGFNAAQHIAEGKYYVSYSNDVVATPHWLEQMLAAMESDARIALAVPACNAEGVSNDQGISVSYPNTFAGLEEMQEFAASHNQMNPALWEERALLMPFLSITRMDVYRIGLVDPIYTRGEFVDDDLSTLLRRTGWRQLLLKDTFMHHFGGVTMGEERYRQGDSAITAMRRVYYEKWGVDAWDGRGYFAGVEDVGAWHTFRADERMLVIEPRFGGIACALVNEYRRQGCAPRMTAVVFDERYLPDTGYLFDKTVPASDIEDAAAKCTGTYDVIAAGCYLDELPLTDVIAGLEQLYGLLAPGGMLLLPVRNPSSAYELTCLMDTGARDVYCGGNEVQPWRSIPYRPLLRAVDRHPYLHNYQVHSMSVHEDAPLAAHVKPLLRMGADAPADLEMSFSVRMFFLGIFKESTQPA
ncbi:glycosyltransferase [uncultured Selenomonas sp.]|uniref:glycosyltransferase n=1 Tax=uncultured Selenomonas sp. TaxID=159275 RepID=UPI0028D3D5FD|nr:glycosyltransferase [uncultured Selenomonas sp.]